MAYQMTIFHIIQDELLYNFEVDFENVKAEF